MGFPPFVNFLGEVYILKMMAYNPFFFLLGIVNFFAVGLYGVLIISSLSQRKSQKFSLKKGRSLREYVVIMVVALHLYCFFLINFFMGGLFYA